MHRSKIKVFYLTLLWIFLTIHSTALTTEASPKGLFNLYVLDRNDRVLLQETGFFVNNAGIASISCEAVKIWMSSLLNTIVIETYDTQRFYMDNLLSKNCINNNAIITVKTSHSQTVVLSKTSLTTSQPVIFYQTDTDGTIKTVKTKIRNIRHSDGLIQLDTLISPSSNGSPIFNLKGEVVAVAVYTLGKTEAYKRFAIPVRHIVAEITRIEKLLEGFKAYSYQPEKAFEKVKQYVGKPQPLAKQPAKTQHQPVLQEPSPTPIQPPVYDPSTQWMQLANGYMKAKRYDDAVNAYKEAMAIKKDDIDVMQRLAMAYIMIQDFSSAIIIYRQALAISPDNEQLMYQLGVVSALNNDKDGVIAQFKALRHKNSERALQLLDLIY